MADSRRLRLNVGDTVAQFRLESVLRTDVFGTTFLARHQGPDGAGEQYAPAALRVLWPVAAPLESGIVTPDVGVVVERAARAQILAEAEALARLEHPNIVRAHVADLDEACFLFTDWVGGQSVGDWLRFYRNDEDEIVSEDVFFGLFLPILDALTAAHDVGLVHGNISPETLMIRDDGSPVLVGFAAAQQAFLRQLGFPTEGLASGYAAHEQYEFAPDTLGPWTDVYGLAALMYRVLTGLAPVDASLRAASTELDMRSAAVAAAGGYPVHLLTAVDAAMAVDRNARPQTMLELQELLFGLTPAPREDSAATSPSLDRGQVYREAAEGELDGSDARLTPKVTFADLDAIGMSDNGPSMDIRDEDTLVEGNSTESTLVLGPVQDELFSAPVATEERLETTTRRSVSLTDLADDSTDGTVSFDAGGDESDFADMKERVPGGAEDSLDLGGIPPTPSSVVPPPVQVPEGAEDTADFGMESPGYIAFDPTLPEGGLHEYVASDETFDALVDTTTLTVPASEVLPSEDVSGVAVDTDEPEFDALWPLESADLVDGPDQDSPAAALESQAPAAEVLELEALESEANEPEAVETDATEPDINARRPIEAADLDLDASRSDVLTPSDLTSAESSTGADATDDSSATIVEPWGATVMARNADGDGAYSQADGLADVSGDADVSDLNVPLEFPPIGDESRLAPEVLADDWDTARPTLTPAAPTRQPVEPSEPMEMREAASTSPDEVDPEAASDAPEDALSPSVGTATTVRTARFQRLDDGSDNGIRWGSTQDLGGWQQRWYQRRGIGAALTFCLVALMAGAMWHYELPNRVLAWMLDAETEQAVPAGTVAVEDTGQQTLQTLLGAAKEAQQRGRWLSPPGDNAFDRYIGALDVDPRSVTALTGIDHVIEHLRTEALAARRRGETQASVVLAEQALRVVRTTADQVRVGPTVRLWLEAETEVMLLQFPDASLNRRLQNSARPVPKTVSMRIDARVRRLLSEAMLAHKQGDTDLSVYRVQTVLELAPDNKRAQMLLKQFSSVDEDDVVLSKDG